MKTTTRNLLILVAAIVVLGTAVIILVTTGSQTSGSSSAQSETSTVSLVTKEVGDVESLQVTNSHGTYTLVPRAVSSSSSEASSQASGESSAVEDTVTYVVEELEKIPQNSTLAETVMGGAFSPQITKTIGNVKDLNEYGLQEPAATVLVTFNDGTTFTYCVGDVSPTDESCYYICEKGSSNVYVAAFDNTSLFEDKVAYIDLTVLSLSTSDTAAPSFEKLSFNGASYDEPFTATKDGDGYTLSSGFAADAEKITEITDALTTLYADSAVAANPGKNTLTKYGFDDPLAVLSFEAGGKQYILTAGKRDGENIYLMLDGTDVIYQVTETAVAAWLDTDLFALRDKSLLSPAISSIKQMDITADRKTSSFAVTRTKDEETSTEETTYYDYTVSCGGKDVTYSVFQTLYNAAVAPEVLEESAERPSGSPDLKITYQYYDSSNADTISFYQASGRRYTAVVNGKTYGMVTASEIDAILERLSSIVG